MRALAFILLPGLLVAAKAGEVAFADPKPVRAAVEKALPFLEKEGVLWHEEKTCLSCHHIPFMAWTHLEAAKRGLPVDQMKLKEWLAWCVEWAEPKGGDDVLAELLVYLPREVLPEPEAQKKFEALPATILSKQKADGSWVAAGQFRGELWPAKEADEATTMLMLLGLQTPWADAVKVKPGVEKAKAWLKVNDAPQSTRSLAMRLLYDHREGDPGRKDELIQKLLSQQQMDGGWSWKVGATGSDPIATGEVMHVLGVIGAPQWEAVSRQRAIDSLLKTQLPDGSWFQSHKRISVKVRPEAKPKVDGIYSYQATGWAVMGLLQMLPEAELAAAGK